MRSLWRRIKEAIVHDDSGALRMKAIAHGYAERAWMDGEVIRKTGEIIPRESNR